MYGASSRPMAGYGIDSYNSGGGGGGSGYTPQAMPTTSNKFSPSDWQASNMSHYNR